MRSQASAQGVIAAFMTPLFLGLAPIFGKLAINAGADSFTVAAWRTALAVALLWLLYFLFARKFIYIYPAGLLGCVVIGVVNGIGSLFYYGGLGLLDASLAQLLNGMYLLFVVLLSRIGGERLDRRMIVRIGLAVLALVILTGFGDKPVSWLGVGLMLANALMFAGTVILSQYVLYEMPAPTVTLYVLTTMGGLVSIVWLAVGKPLPLDAVSAVIPPIVILALTTAASRLAMFASVKFLGSLQTAILALTEIGVALSLAFVVLGDRLNTAQVIGVAILVVSILLIRAKDMLPHGINPNRLVSDLADLQYMWIAFDQAFVQSKKDDTNPHKLSTTEMSMIRQMMGAERGAVRPYTVNKADYAHVPGLKRDE